MSASTIQILIAFAAGFLAFPFLMFFAENLILKWLISHHGKESLKESLKRDMQKLAEEIIGEADLKD